MKAKSKIIFRHLPGLLATLILFILNLPDVYAQEEYHLISESRITIEGTSNLHDWETQAESIKGDAQLKVENGQVESIGNVKVNIPVKSIESGKNIMDKKTFDALKGNKYPNISFVMNKVETTTPDKVAIVGDLNIAGVSRPVEINANYSIHGQTVQFQGKLPVRMSQFNIDPPTALFGTLKTKDEVTIAYKAVFTRNGNE